MNPVVLLYKTTVCSKYLLKYTLFDMTTHLCYDFHNKNHNIVNNFNNYLRE